MKNNRREFLCTGLAVAAAAVSMTNAPGNDGSGSPKPKPFELDDVSLGDLQEGLKSGKYTSRLLVDKYLERIEAVDRSGPALKSVIEVNPDAADIADALDKERKQKGARGPLHGIPILIKDNIDTADGMATTAGSLALVGSKPAQDAFVVKRLRDAGAVILGKTNLSEWANFRSSASTSGWSGRGGLTRNPYALDRNPSGSSSGSAVAVSASLCAAAVGTETDGSIVSPASINGIVGVKPTVGLISRSGIIPISETQDTAGPMARTVRDAAILLTALAGVDADDKATAAGKGKAADYEKALDAKALKGARLGVVRKLFGFNDAVDDITDVALALLKREGAVLIDPVDVDAVGKLDDNEMTVLLYEFKAGLNAYLSKLGEKAPVHSLEQVIDFNRKNKAKEMPYFGQDLLVKAQRKGPLTDKDYKEALESNLKLTRAEGIDAVMDKHKLDALVSPTAGPAWVTDLLVGGGGAGGSTQLAAVSGYPHVTVPAGHMFGLPVGLSFYGRAWSETTLLKLAHAFEQAMKARKPPNFLETVKLG